MKTVAYLRVSTGGQDLANQRLAILDYARGKRISVDQFVEVQLSSRRKRQKEHVLEAIGTLEKGDRFIVSELSRLGRSLGQIIQAVDTLVKKGVRVVSIKESIHFEGRQSMQTKVMVTLFGLFAEIERDLISERTKEGLAAAKARGRLLGRPRGSTSRSKLDGKEEEIRDLISKGVSKASIAKIVGVSPSTLHHFILSRSLQERPRKKSRK